VTARVLIVDDQRPVRELLARAVEQLGHDAVTAGDGYDALARLRDETRPVDVVLLDVVMPGLDGLATLQAIKQDPCFRHLPVVMVSAVDDMANVVRAIELGAIDHLPKPVDRAILAARLQASLADKRVRDLELDHLRQVERVVAAAVAIEAGDYRPRADLEVVAARDDALGTLARTVRRLATEVRDREASLRAQLDRLRVAVDRDRVDAQVAEVTGSDYYRRLSHEAADLKRLLRDGREGA
jgi:CheY-like chemotaxis protein